MRLRLAISVVLAVSGSVFSETLTARVPRFSGRVNEAELARVQSLSAPMISSRGDVYVTTRAPQRNQLRWPVLRFAVTTLERFADAYYDIGSRESPLSIELGSETNAVTTLRRDRVQTADGFSQLIIRIPNPDTVDLDALRVAVLEAPLREEARALRGSYGALKWPRWFLQGAVDATRGPLALMDAYERLQMQIAASGMPQVAAFFDAQQEPSREAAAFFARWMLEKRRSALGEHAGSAREVLGAFVVTDWTPGAVLAGETQASWEAWIRQLDNRVFLPGVLTREQFRRWRAGVRRDLSPAAAQTQRHDLIREMVGRPKPFTDLSTLYLKATDALIAGNRLEAMELFTEADAAAELLESHLERTGYLVSEGVLLAPEP